MHCRIRLTNQSRQSLIEQLQHAYRVANLRLVKRIHALLYIVEGHSVAEVCDLLHLGEQTVRDYLRTFIRNGIDSLRYRRPPGRPARLTQTQRKELTALLTAGPERAGYTSGCWPAIMVQDLVLQRFGVMYHPHYLCNLLSQLGLSFQKARFVSDHLDEEARQQWWTYTWPEILQFAQRKKALILFGDEVSFAQWGSLSYTWAPKGHQPTVKTSGKRKSYKVFGLIEFFSGRFLWHGGIDRFNSDGYAAFLTEVLAQTKGHLILIQDGAKYHTSHALKQFFAAHADRLTKFQLPSYSPDFNPIEYLWRKVKKAATHLNYFPTFAALTQKVEHALQCFADRPSEILGLMGRYCESLGTAA